MKKLLGLVLIVALLAFTSQSFFAPKAYASISAATALTSNSEVNASDTTFDTASISPTSGSVVFLAMIMGALDIAPPTVTGAGLTWTNVAEIPNGGGSETFLYYGVGTASAGALTVTRQGSDTWNSVIWEVFEFTGVNTASPVVVANTATDAPGSASATITVNYPQAFAAGGAGLGVYGFGGGGGTATPRANWTEIDDDEIGSTQFMETQYRLASDTAGSATAPSSGYNLMGIVTELVADPCEEGETCTDVFSTAGYTEFTVPEGVTSLDIACWGGGGGGFDGGTGGGGSGGGGGALASSTEAVSPSDVIRLFIGAGGAEGLNGATSTASTTAPTLLVSAAPGWGGGGAVTPVGLGGSVASSTGDYIRAGGKGGQGIDDGTHDGGGGGGGSGGPSSNGTGETGSNAIGGATDTGGAGGDGNGTDNAPTNGGLGGTAGNGGAGGLGGSHVFGGGGGGGGDNGQVGGNGGTPGGGGGGGETNGGVGGTGKCTITYTVASSEGPATSSSRYIKNTVFYVKDTALYLKN